MALDPRAFRGLSPSEIMAVLMIEERVGRGVAAKAAGASCIECKDTGMSISGAFCGCSQGSILARQGFTS